MKESQHIAAPFAWGFAAIVCLLLSYHAHTHITGHPTDGDSRQNLKMAYNLYANGALSLDSQAPFKASNVREPLPPFVTAFFIALYPDLGLQLARDGVLQDHGIAHGEGARWVKQVNVIWILLGLSGCWVLAYSVCGSHRAAIVVVVAAYLFFFSVRTTNDPLNIRVFNDSLYTELPAAVLMLWTGMTMVWLTRSSGVLPPALSGLLLGFLALTKAAFLFVFAALLPLLIAYYVVVRRDLKAPTRWGSIALFCIGFIIVVLPWMARNQVQLDRFEIAERGGLTLYVRALKDQMTSDETVGAYWYWGPRLYQRLVRGTPLGASDGDFAVGGRFERVNRYRLGGDKEAALAGKPEGAVSFYWHARAVNIGWVKRFEAMGVPDPKHAADGVVQQQAERMIFDAPGRHLAMTPLFLWRGIWCFREDPLPYQLWGYQAYTVNVINALAYLSLFCVFGYAVARRRYDLLAMTVVPLAMLGFYALLSHNIPRYAAPAIPIMLASLALIVCGAFSHWRKQRG